MPDSLSGASDTELLAIAAQVLSVVDPNPAAYGTTATVVSALDTKKDVFNTDLTAHTAAQANARSKTETKNTSRTDLIEALRSLRNVAKAAGTSEAAMDALGIPQPSFSAPATVTVPIGKVDTRERLRHTINWADADSPDNKRRPRGTMGAEIWVKLDGPPPTDESQCSFLTLDSATPYLAEFDGGNAGKMAHYLMRWRMRDGSTGAWGETVSATITG